MLEAYDLCEAVENLYFKRVATIPLAQVCFELGENHHASTLYRQALASAREDEHTEAICYALTGLAALSYEWNDLESAYQQAQEVIALKRQELHEVHATLIQTRVLQAQGQITAAQQRLAALLEKIPASLPDLSEEIQTARARLALAVGDHMSVQRWATARKPHHVFSQEMELMG